MSKQITISNTYSEDEAEIIDKAKICVENKDGKSYNKKQATLKIMSDFLRDNCPQWLKENK
ncbi:hypothetical protein KA005_72235 [bacterium]|nr:hypothetical protein [bacterium]